jgi:hypothetical protein
MFKFRKWFFMGPEGDAGAGGGAAGADGDTGAAAVDPAAGDTGATGAAAAGTAATAGADTATALAQGAQAAPVAIPEKYQVKKADGTIDTEASSLKLAEAYTSLEKRLGSGDLPPKAVEDYKITVPPELAETWKPSEDPLLQGFLKDAHAAGMNQKQIDVVMAKYMEMAPELVNASRALDADACVTELRAEWKSEPEYKKGVGDAYKAAVGYFGKDADGIIQQYGNDPRVIRGLAAIGKEMGEDRPGNFNAPSSQGDIDSLLVSPAYNDSKHPEHAKVSAQVKQHFDRIAAAAEKAGNQRIL